MANPACGKNDPSAAQPPLDDASREEIENWGYRWLTAVENRRRLDTWDQRSDILGILPPPDTENIADCDMAALAILRGTLEHWYHHYQTQATQDHLAANSDGARNPLPDRAHDDGEINVDTSSTNHRLRSTSAPVPPLPVGHSFAARVAGVGPSRLPSISLRAPEHGNNVASGSNSRGHSQTQGEKTPRGYTRRPSPKCSNKGAYLGAPPERGFEPCHCGRCLQKSRSVHVGPMDLSSASSSDAQAAVTDSLSKYGHVEDCRVQRSAKGIYYALGRFAADDSTHRAVRASGELARSHPILHRARVTYPFFSRYYQYRMHSTRETERSYQLAAQGNPPPGIDGDLPTGSTPSQSTMQFDGYSGSSSHAHGPWNGFYPQEGPLFQQGDPFVQQYTMPYPPANHNADADVSTQRENRRGGAYSQTKPPSENEAFEDLTTTIPSSNHSFHSSHSSAASTGVTPAIRVRIPEPAPVRRTIDPDSPVRQITFGNVPPNGEKKKKPQDGDENRGQPVIIPNHNSVRSDSSVRRITFGDVASDPEPQEPPTAIPDHNEARPDSPVRSVISSDLSTSNSRASGSIEPTRPTQPPAATRPVIEGNRIPTLSDEWDSPFFRQLEEADYLRSRYNEGENGRLRDQGDVRLLPDYSGTVIRRRPGPENGRVADLSDGVASTSGEKGTAGWKVAAKKKSKGKKKGGKAAVVDGNGAAAESKTDEVKKNGSAGEMKTDSAAEVQHDASVGKGADTMGTIKNQTVDPQPDNKTIKNDPRPLNYRADAGGSLRIPRQRFKKKTSRGSVQDLFKDHDQATQE
ncbi:hypothetical protein F5144DRAFT_654653 [Chaetomium tenue]|uniref:Uncharacterized protein n=1 Tax=Chaetomium tenue TaxID=1854479 RepID=A0ACB7P3V4_9PEZI|nr:hypothetical protein F5144DRAFT_654653 [Chaetomium globosum]